MIASKSWCSVLTVASPLSLLAKMYRAHAHVLSDWPAQEEEATTAAELLVATGLQALLEFTTKFMTLGCVHLARAQPCPCGRYLLRMAHGAAASAAALPRQHSSACTA